jgi:hypothetical protein
MTTTQNTLLRFESGQKMLSKIKNTIVVLSTVGLLSACATGGINTNASDFQSKFASGSINLTCALSCAGTYGASRAELRSLYDNRRWAELAKSVASIGYENDQAYFYLGAAAAGLNYRAAARSYLNRAATTRMKCGGSPNVCDGFVFPANIYPWITALNNADAKDAAAKEAAARNAAAKEAAAKAAAARDAAARTAAARDAADRALAEKDAAANQAAALKTQEAAIKAQAEAEARTKAAAEELQKKQMVKDTLLGI